MYSMHAKRKPKKQPRATVPSASSATTRSETTAKHLNMKTEVQMIRGSDNVFEDLGFSPAEAANLTVRADLLLDLRHYIHAQGWTQAQAAAFFGETQPRMSNLLNGEISRFSVDKLINMLSHAGKRVRVEVIATAA